MSSCDLDGLKGDGPDVNPELHPVQWASDVLPRYGASGSTEEDQGTEHEHVAVALEVHATGGPMNNVTT